MLTCKTNRHKSGFLLRRRPRSKDVVHATINLLISYLYYFHTLAEFFKSYCGMTFIFFNIYHNIVFICIYLGNANPDANPYKDMCLYVINIQM